MKNQIKKILNLKLVIMLEFEIMIMKGYSPSWSEEVFVINKIKNTAP